MTVNGEAIFTKLDKSLFVKQESWRNDPRPFIVDYDHGDHYSLRLGAGIDAQINWHF
jgi:hypothetical protein